MIFNKRIIKALLLICVFVIGLQIVESVNAIEPADIKVNPKIDTGTLKINGRSVNYDTYYYVVGKK